jgi:hypothetical protein
VPSPASRHRRAGGGRQRRRLAGILGIVLTAGFLHTTPAAATVNPAASGAPAAASTILSVTPGPATAAPSASDRPTPHDTVAPDDPGTHDPAVALPTPAVTGGTPGPVTSSGADRGLSPFAARAVPAQGVVVRPAGYGEVRLGPYAGPAGAPEHGYCVQARVSPTGPEDVPVSVGLVVDPLLAAALAEHRGSADDLTQAALALTVHQRHERPGTMEGGDAEAAVRAVVAATPQAVLDRQAEILSGAARAAGPFTADAGPVDASERRTGVLRGIALRSATGETVAGKPFTVTLHGPAVFDLTGEPTYRGTTGTEPIDLTWTATGTGTVTSEVRFHGATRTTLTLYDMAGNRQDQVSYGNRPGHDPETIVRELPPFEVAADFQPVAVSDVGGSKVVDAGQPITDTLTVSAAPGDTWLRVDGEHVPVLLEGTAYGVGTVPVAPRGDVPVDAPVVSRTTVTATGPGTYTATADGPASGQVVTWVWRVVKAHQPPEHRALVRGDWSDAYGIAEETTSVRWTTGTVDSALSIRTTQGGTYLVDDLMVTGMPEDHPGFAGGHGLRPDHGTLTQELWFFAEGVPVDEDHLAEADLRGSVEIPARNGFHPSISHPSFRVQEVDGRPVPGTYVFRTVFAGDDRVAAFASSVTDVTEQHLVAGDPLRVTTRAQADRQLVAGQPGVLHDVATVDGTTPPGATLEFALHRWDGDRPTCTEETLVDRTAPVALTGPGEHPSAPVTVDTLVPGRYGYVETVRAADGRVLHRGECGVSAETLVARIAPEPPAQPEDPAQAPAPVTSGSATTLAVTGAPLAALAGVALLALAAGVLAVGVRRRSARRAAADRGGAGRRDEDRRTRGEEVTTG